MGRLRGSRKAYVVCLGRGLSGDSKTLVEVIHARPRMEDIRLSRGHRLYVCRSTARDYESKAKPDNDHTHKVIPLIVIRGRESRILSTC